MMELGDRPAQRFRTVPEPSDTSAPSDPVFYVEPAERLLWCTDGSDQRIGMRAGPLSTLRDDPFLERLGVDRA